MEIFSSGTIFDWNRLEKSTQELEVLKFGKPVIDDGYIGDAFNSIWFDQPKYLAGSENSETTAWGCGLDPNNSMGKSIIFPIQNIKTGMYTYSWENEIIVLVHFAVDHLKCLFISLYSYIQLEHMLHE